MCLKNVQTKEYFPVLITTDAVKVVGHTLTDMSPWPTIEHLTTSGLSARLWSTDIKLSN